MNIRLQDSERLLSEASGNDECNDTSTRQKPNGCTVGLLSPGDELATPSISSQARKVNQNFSASIEAAVQTNQCFQYRATKPRIIQRLSSERPHHKGIVQPTPIQIAAVAAVAATADTTKARPVVSVAPAHACSKLEDRDNSHVIRETPVAASSPSRAREQEMSLTPPLPAPPSPSRCPGGGTIIGANLSPSIIINQLTGLPTPQNDRNSTNIEFKPISHVNGVRMKSRPKKKGPIMSPPPTPPSFDDDSKSNETKMENNSSNLVSNSNDNSLAPSGVGHNNLPVIFTWDLYLKLAPADVAPKDAFNQPSEYPSNFFKLDMKLEVRDPRNISVWGLATVVGIEGLYLRLRFDNTDKSNDVYELIDSDRIRPIGSTGEPLLPPVNFKGNIANYTKFVEKVLADPSTVIAPPEHFPPNPNAPEKNLFKIGMKLEAIDMKNRYLVCPATIGQVQGNTVKIVFDGWRGSFDYNCDYRSRDIFPINWCRDTGHSIQPPNGWESLVKSGNSPTKLTPGKTLHTQSKSTSIPMRIHMDSETVSSKRPSCFACPQVVKAGNSESESPSVLISHRGSNRAFKLSSRGRPPKDPSKLASKLTPAQASKTTATKSTIAIKKVETGKKANSGMNSDKESNIFGSCSPESASSLGDTFNDYLSSTSSSSSTLTYGSESVCKYQCQRVVPYNEWKSKKDDMQMPRKDAEQASSNEMSQNQEDSTLSFTNSTSSLSSTFACSSSNQDNVHKSKKLRPDFSGDVVKKNDQISAILDSKPEMVSSWSVSDVIELISTDETLAKYSTVFMENEIDGKAFILLNREILLKHMGLKIGPYLKIADLIEKVKKLKYSPNHKT